MKTPQLDGCYLIKTDRQDLSGDKIWRIYVLLTRAEIENRLEPVASALRRPALPLPRERFSPNFRCKKQLRVDALPPAADATSTRHRDRPNYDANGRPGYRFWLT